MKKLLVLLLALATVGGFAFAQDPALTFSGYLYTGVEYSDAGLKLYNANTGNTTRVRLNAAYTNGDFGVNFRYQSSDFTAPTVGQALVWGKFFDGLLTVKAGKLNDYSWATSYYAWGNFDGQTGLQFNLKPVDGLQVGAFLPLAATDVTLENTFKNLAIGAAYSMADVGSFKLGLDLGTAANMLYFGTNITAVENLDAYVELKIADLSAVEPFVMEYVTYAIGETLLVGVYADQTIGTPFAWSVAPEVAFTGVENLELGASFTYASDNSYSIDPYAVLTLNSKSNIKFYAGFDGALTAGANFKYAF